MTKTADEAFEIIRSRIEDGIDPRVNSFKKEKIIIKPKVKYQSDKKEIGHPKQGKSISKFCREVSDILKRQKSIYYRIDSKQIVEISNIKTKNTAEKKYTGFSHILPNRFITAIEKYLSPGIWDFDRAIGNFIFREKSISSQLSSTLLASEILQNSLPQINRIFTIPIPVIWNGELTFPKKGYDIRFLSWLSPDAPEISNRNLTIDEAKQIINNMLKEFCFQTTQDKVNAIAGLLTPFLRGLYVDFNIRTPPFFYLGNRERVGKDYLAGITGIIYENMALEESPISFGGNSNSNDELRKKILAAMIAGRKRMHFSNNRGFINNPVFESVITSRVWTDRILGKNETLNFDNEIEFSLSGNIGVSYTPDLANRCRFIRLFLDIENANLRQFSNPILHDWIKKNRDKILSALFALVRNWIENGKPNGKIPFASFPEWANICGGVMECADLGNPCIPDNETIELGGDIETQEMKLLFEICETKYGKTWITIQQVRETAEKEDIFDFTLADKSGQTKFSHKINKFMGRILSDIKLICKNKNIRGAKREIMFSKII